MYHVFCMCMYLDIVGVGAVVSVPEEHPDAVEEVRLTQLDRDSLAAVSADGVSGVALLSVVALCVSIEESILHLTLHCHRVVLRGGNVLFWNWWREEEEGRGTEIEGKER